MKSITPRVIPRVLQLSLCLSARCSTDQGAVFQRRLGHYLAGSGFGWKVRGTSLYVGSGDVPIGPLERALLLTWLVSQPEVVRVRIVRCGGAHAL